MIVKCINKSVHRLGLEFGFEPTYLEIDKLYNVYGLEIINNNTFVFVSDHKNSSYPSRYLLRYFDVISSNVSKYWHLNLKNNGLQIIVEDWIRHQDFMRIYIDGFEPNPELYGLLSSFYEIKELIDKENIEIDDMV